MFYLKLQKLAFYENLGHHIRGEKDYILPINSSGHLVDEYSKVLLYCIPIIFFLIKKTTVNPLRNKVIHLLTLVGVYLFRWGGGGIKKVFSLTVYITHKSYYFHKIAIHFHICA